MTGDLLQRVLDAQGAFDRVLVAPVQMLDRVGPTAKAEILTTLADQLEAEGFTAWLDVPEKCGGEVELRIRMDLGDATAFELFVSHRDYIGAFRKAAKDGQKQFRELERFARSGNV